MLKRSGDESRMSEVSEMLVQKPPLGTPLDFDNPLNKGCAMHLAMNEGHGDVVRDLSMNGNNGTLKNVAFPSTAASGWNPGMSGVGLNFEAGGSNYIDCGTNPSLIQSKISVSVWFRKKTDHIGQLITSTLTDATKTDFSMFLYTNNRLYFDVGNGVASGRSYFGAGEVNSGWNHAIGTYDGSNVLLYLNGVLTTNASVLTGDISRSGASVYVGTHSGFTNYLNASIDQVRIHNRALTAKEVMDYYINPWQVYEQ